MGELQFGLNLRKRFEQGARAPVYAIPTASSRAGTRDANRPSPSIPSTRLKTSRGRREGRLSINSRSSATSMISVVKPRFSSAVATPNSASRVSYGLSLCPYTTGMKPRCGGSPRSLAIDSFPLVGSRLYHAILERTGDALLSPDVCYWHKADSDQPLLTNLDL